MDKLKEFYNRYQHYLTRTNFEIAAVTLIALSAILVFTSNIPDKGVLTLDKGAIKYDGSLVHGKMDGQGTLTFKNGDKYEGDFKNGIFDGKGKFTSKSGWKYEGEFSKGQADGQGTLITEQKVVFISKDSRFASRSTLSFLPGSVSWRLYWGGRFLRIFWIFDHLTPN